MHARRLQSGRILCLPRSPAPKAEVAARYRLRPDNVLVARDDETAAYTGASYFVLQVDARRNRALEDFDHFVGAADLLAKTNRRGAAVDVLNEVVDVARKAADVDGLLDIEKLALDAGDAPRTAGDPRDLQVAQAPRSRPSTAAERRRSSRRSETGRQRDRHRAFFPPLVCVDDGSRSAGAEPQLPRDRTVRT